MNRRQPGIRAAAMLAAAAVCLLAEDRARPAEPPDRAALLVQFAAAKDVDAQLALLPKLTAALADDQLSDPARYLLALETLRPHLTWHAPPLPPKADAIGKRIEKLMDFEAGRWRDDNDWRWAEGHQGEPWMLQKLPPKRRKQLDAALKAYAEAADSGDRPIPAYWHLTDPGHADVLRALKLLEAVNSETLRDKARRWIAEIRRNNTVLTLDILGGYAKSRPGPVVLDCRGTEKVAFRLYRVQGGADLLWTAARIGEDFMYRDYGLQFGQPPDFAMMAEQLDRLAELRLLRARRDLPRPAFRDADRVASWSVRVSELKPLPAVRRRHWDRWDGCDQDEESSYFNDRDRHYRDRVRKEYRREPRDGSAWQCDRIVEIPADALKQPGGYILVAEANGQQCVGPILVEPLSLTLRRCRDGVFVLASDSEGAAPVAGAAVLAEGLLRPVATDAAGAAFAKVFAAGDRAILVAKDGRYAIGGFGELFEGLYVSQWELDLLDSCRYKLAARSLRKLVEQDVAHVYADRCVVAAYTDRPTYRPGQKVQFKLIARRLRAADGENATNAEIAFRAEDFERAAGLELLPEGTALRYEILNPRGRVVAAGGLTLNDFGTCSAEADLSEEAAVGVYSLRVRLDGIDRVVPQVFAVKYYRRPNFEITVTGVPEKLASERELKLRVAGRYYFGKPVEAGTVEVRLVRPDQWKPIAEATAPAAADGSEVTLRLPKRIAAGSYFLLCSMTDASGRTVSTSQPIQIGDEGKRPATDGLSALPRFIELGKALSIRTDAREIVAKPASGDGAEVRFAARRRQEAAEVQLPSGGWWTLTAGDQRTEVFVYGDLVAPLDPREPQREKRADEPPREPRWVDLTRYNGEDYDERYDGCWDDAWNRESERLLALFDGHHARVGGVLRVLLYVPYERARVLLTVEGRTVVDYVLSPAAAKEIAGCYRVVELPIHGRYLPNFYLQGRILPAGVEAPRRFKREEELQKEARRLQELEDIDESTEDPRWCRVDVIDPDARPGEEKLNVAIETDSSTHRPGERVCVEMRVTDAAGRPRAAEVSLGAVDQSVYSFGEDATGSLAAAFADPHPDRRYARKTWRSFCAARLYADRQPIMRLIDRAQAMQQMAEQLSKSMDAARALGASPAALAPPLPSPASFGEMPVGQLPAARLRADFRETAAWQPHLRTGPDGRVRTWFDLPDSLTAYRMTAVALTKQTEIGTARAEVRARLPLAVQVFLPRFAVEGDRLLAVGLVHNSTDRERTCTVTWNVSGAKAEKPRDRHLVFPDESHDRDKATSEKPGACPWVFQLTIPAGGSARVPLWLAMERPGEAVVDFQAADGADADAERRSLTVQPLGRPREVMFNGELSGQRTLQLPAGFTAAELLVSLSRADAVDALDGLGYLVDYPYGCVEQTMSRFLPAVMVARAIRQVPVKLPADVAAKLPDVLAKGLERLYNFQHDDGGWGWWEKDATHEGMTIYVVYGLARCRQTGTKIDEAVLGRGCDLLKQWLAEARDGKRKIEPDAAARMWLAVALAGQADSAALAADAEKMLQAASERAHCNLALACHAAGLADAAKRHYAKASDWAPDATADLALLLQARAAFAAPAAECRAAAAKLTARRQGHHWESTRDTSWAVEALADVLASVQVNQPAKRIRIAVAGRTLLDAADAGALRRLVHRAAAPADLLAGREAAKIELTAEAPDGQPFRYAVTARGTQRQDMVAPFGEEVKLHRAFASPDGKPISQRLRVGEVVAVHLTVELAAGQDFVIVEDRRPAGFEFAGDELSGPAAGAAANVEFRDDRLCAFFTHLAAGRHELVYYLRAETAGVSHVLPGCAYPMYAEKERGETGAATLEVGEGE